MSNSKSRNALAVAAHLALGAGLGVAAAAEPGAAGSADGDQAGKEAQLGKIQVDAAVGEYKVDQAQSPKYTEPLRDTAQTVTVIPAELIQQQGTLLLRDILRQNVPGITFGAGEGGSYGDSINIRGFAATNDIAVDGVRQSANTTHTDPFDTQAIEVVQGTSSVYSGVGALGGTINYVSKLPTAADFANLGIGAGTADYVRAAADVNQRFGDPDLGMAFRVNAMAHRNEVADRDVTSYTRWGIAPSFAIGLGTPTRFTLAYLHEHDRNLPEYGIPLRNFALVPGIDRDNYYGFSNVDVEKIDDDALTGILTHDFGSSAAIRNLTRAEQYDRYSITDAAEGRICLAPGQYPIGTNLQAPGTTLRCAAAGANPLEGVGGPTYTPGGPIGNLRDTRNRIIANQTDLTLRFRTGVIDHSLVVGAAFSGEWYWQTTGGEYRNSDGSTYLLLPQPLYDPSHYFTQPLNLTVAGKARSTVANQAGYVFDTLKFQEHWLLGVGARYEHNKASYRSWTATPAAGLGVAPGPLVPASTNPLVNDDDLLSYRATLLYKPVEPGSIYFAYGNSKLPSASTVNGSCTTNCNVDPQNAVTYELGTKWDLLDEQLALTAAVFRTDRTNYLVASGDPSVPAQQLDGRARVDGEQIGLAGNITRNWAVFANYAHLRSEVLQSVSNHTLALTGIDAQKGNPLANTPGNSANLWTTYKLPHGLTVGYGVSYTSWVWATANNATATAIYNRATIPGFVVHNLMTSYSVSRLVSLQLNVTNLFDKEYFTQLRTVSTTSGWVYPGAGRTATLTALLAF
ncbi:MAG TPA: TonB-dependent receptor [Steroidobacteraceae bacterium]|nr:TonB-dependent receptor [Steroidobacteraceae bacterium]